MDSSSYDAFTTALTERLAADDRVLAVLGLGSLADSVIRDRQSDHDLWLVVTPDSQSSFLSDLSWLPHPEDHLAAVRFGNRGASVLYRDQHSVEVAVFTEASLEGQPTDRIVVLLDRARIGPRLPALVGAARAQRDGQVQWPDAIANLALVVWTGVRRYRRGEHLSAHKILRYQAINVLLDAAQGAGLLGHPHANFLDPWRRLEVVHPRLAVAVARTFAMAAPAAAIALLDLAIDELREAMPSQAWDALLSVRGWIKALPSTDQDQQPTP